MSFRTMAAIPGDLSAAIIRDPLVVSPQTAVLDAITQMSRLSPREGIAQTIDPTPDQPCRHRSSCVLVVAHQQVVGILTAQDVVHLVAQQYPLQGVTVEQVMTQPVVSLRESAFTDAWSATQLLQQQHIRHLPIVDGQARLVGLVTADRLQQIIAAQPAPAAQVIKPQVDARRQGSEQRYASFMAAPVGIFCTDPRGNCTDVNERWCQLAGLTPAQAFGQGWQQALHPEDRGQVVTAWQQATVNNLPFHLEYRFLHPDGTVRWVQGEAIA